MNTSTQNLADEPILANGPPTTRTEMTCMPLNKSWQMNLLWPMDPLPHSTRAEMPCIPVHKTWQMNLLWLMDPPVPEQRCLEYQYTKLDRWTKFGWWTPRTRAEMPWIPVHKTWQMILLWPIDPPLPEQRCHEYQYTKLGRWTYFGQWTPHYQNRDDLHATKPNLADEPTLANGPPTAQYQSRDALNTSIQNLADEPTLANGPPPVPEQRCLAYQYTKLDRLTNFGWWTPHTRAEMPWIPVHKTWQINQLWLMDPPLPEQQCLEYQYTKLDRLTNFGWWTPVPEQRCLEYQYTKLGRWSYFGQWTPFTRAEMPWIPVHKTWQMNLFWPMDPPAQEQWWLSYHPCIHHFSDTPQHFLKTHFSSESGFLLFLELQKSLLESFQGCWAQWQRFETSSIHHFWDTHSIFSKHIFA